MKLRAVQDRLVTRSFALDVTTALAVAASSAVVVSVDPSFDTMAIAATIVPCSFAASRQGLRGALGAWACTGAIVLGGQIDRLGLLGIPIDRTAAFLAVAAVSTAPIGWLAERHRAALHDALVREDLAHRRAEVLGQVAIALRKMALPLPQDSQAGPASDGVLDAYLAAATAAGASAASAYVRSADDSWELCRAVGEGCDGDLPPVPSAAVRARSAVLADDGDIAHVGTAFVAHETVCFVRVAIDPRRAGLVLDAFEIMGAHADRAARNAVRSAPHRRVDAAGDRADQNGWSEPERLMNSDERPGLAVSAA